MNDETNPFRAPQTSLKPLPRKSRLNGPGVLPALLSGWLGLVLLAVSCLMLPVFGWDAVRNPSIVLDTPFHRPRFLILVGCVGSGLAFLGLSLILCARLNNPKLWWVLTSLAILCAVMVAATFL